MTRDHIQALRLSSILGDLPVEQFRREYIDRRHLHVSQAIPTERLRDVMTLERFDELLIARNIQYPNLEVIEDGRPGPAPQEAPGRNDAAKLIAKVLAGATIRLRSVEEADTGVRTLCAVIGNDLNENVQANTYFTPPANQAFRPHYDTHDVWIVQCWGRKSWRIYGDYRNQIPIPLDRQSFYPDKNPAGPITHEFEMVAGDVLYLPRGLMHDANCVDEGSLHLSLAAGTLSRAQVMLHILRKLEEEDPSFRSKVWRDELSDPAKVAEICAQFAANVAKYIDLAKVGPDLAERFVREGHAVRVGQVAAGVAGVKDTHHEAYEYDDTMVWRHTPAGDKFKVFLPSNTLVLGPSEFAVLTEMTRRGVANVADIQQAVPGVAAAKALAMLARYKMIKGV